MKNKSEVDQAFCIEQKISDQERSADFREIAWADKLKLALGEKKRIERQTGHDVRLVKVWNAEEELSEDTPALEELLAEAFHLAWSSWSQEVADDGGITPERMERWEKFWTTDWEDISEEDKKSDYRQVQKFYNLVDERLVEEE